jgi:hypothetical protein
MRMLLSNGDSSGTQRKETFGSHYQGTGEGTVD